MEHYATLFNHCVRNLKIRNVEDLPNVIYKRLLAAYIRDCVEPNQIDPITSENMSYREFEDAIRKYSDSIQNMMEIEYLWNFDKDSFVKCTGDHSFDRFIYNIECVDE